jgi:hypothetical protein
MLSLRRRDSLCCTCLCSVLWKSLTPHSNLGREHAEKILRMVVDGARAIPVPLVRNRH